MREGEGRFSLAFLGFVLFLLGRRAKASPLVHLLHSQHPLEIVITNHPWMAAIALRNKFSSMVMKTFWN